MDTPQPDLPPQPDATTGQPQPNPQPEAQPQPSEPTQPATPQPVPVPEDQPPEPQTPKSVPEPPQPVTPPPVTPQPVQRGQPEPQLPWGESDGSHMTLPDVEPARLVQLREELVERVEEVENDQERKSVVYSIAEEAARLLGLSQYSNRLVVVGTQSSGKSSLLEALLQLPLGFTGEGTATMAAVVYSIRRNAQLTEPRCSIQWQGTRYCDLDLPQLNEKLSAIMTELREIDTQNAVEVTIEDPKVTTITLVDLPGQIAPETLDDSRRRISKEAIRTLIANYLERYPSRNGPLQRILWVKRADFDRAHDPITADLFTDIDPHYTRTMVAATHTDKLSDLRGQALESRLLQSWVDQRIPSIEPWFIALHSIAPERKQRCAWNELRDDIADQLRTKEASLAFADQLGSSKLHRSHWGWTNFKKQLQGQVNRDFIDNAQLLLSKLLELASRLEREKSVHEEAINPSLAGRTGLSIADEFIDAFRNRLAQLLHYEALDQAFLHKFGRTLADEDSAALHYLLAHNAAPVPRGGGNHHAGVVNADRRAITFVRAHRVNAENLLRINALKPDDFTDDQLLAAIPASAAIDLLNPPEALAALLVRSLKNHLLPFVPYAVWRMAYCMVDSFDPVIELLRELPEYKFIADNAIFVCSLKQAFAEWVEMRARGCEKRLRGSLASFWAYQSWNLPVNLHPRMDQGMMQEVDGSLNHVMTNPNTLHIGGSRILEDVKEILAEQFEAHKVMFAINIKHTITSEIMSSADPRREPETREERLGVFLKSRLTSPAVCGTKTDPHGICRQSQELADKAKLLGEQAEAIRGLHQELMLQLSSLRNIADDLSVH